MTQFYVNHAQVGIAIHGYADEADKPGRITLN